MSKNVVVDNVTSGGTASNPTAVLHYIGSDNTVWKIANLASKLDESSKAKLRSVKKGDVVSVDMVKEGKFWNLVSVGEPVAETKGKGSGTAKPGGYDSLGNQIGNCITNAVNSLGQGHTTKEYKTRAEEFLQMGDEIRANAEAGVYKNPLIDDTLDLHDPDVTDKLGF